MVHAIAALFTNGLAIKFGKRPLFLAANVIMFASALWGFNATTWPSLLACQIIGSVGVAPYQTLVAATVADLYFSFVFGFDFRYFVHQRGGRLALWTVFASVGACAGPIVSGFLIQHQGWQMAYKLCMY